MPSVTHVFFFLKNSTPYLNTSSNARARASEEILLSICKIVSLEHCSHTRLSSNMIYHYTSGNDPRHYYYSAVVGGCTAALVESNARTLLIIKCT
jgi:hypothetical protein